MASCPYFSCLTGKGGGRWPPSYRALHDWSFLRLLPTLCLNLHRNPLPWTEEETAVKTLPSLERDQ